MQANQLLKTKSFLAHILCCSKQLFSGVYDHMFTSHMSLQDLVII